MSHDRLRRRGGWITEVRREFDALRPRTPARRYVAGETHRCLGRQYRLRFEPEGPKSVRIERDRIIMSGVASGDAERASRMIVRWYGARAREVFDARLERVLARFRPEGVPKPVLNIRRLERRWGSLSRDGRTLVLNLRLIEAAPELIDYVLAHELAHAVHPHHGPEFFALLERKMPDWAKRKWELERSLL